MYHVLRCVSNRVRGRAEALICWCNVSTLLMLRLLTSRSVRTPTVNHALTPKIHSCRTISAQIAPQDLRWNLYIDLTLKQDRSFSKRTAISPWRSLQQLAVLFHQQLSIPITEMLTSLLLFTFYKLLHEHSFTTHFIYCSYSGFNACCLIKTHNERGNTFTICSSNNIVFR